MVARKFSRYIGEHEWKEKIASDEETEFGGEGEVGKTITTSRTFVHWNLSNNNELGLAKCSVAKIAHVWVIEGKGEGGGGMMLSKLIIKLGL